MLMELDRNFIDTKTKQLNFMIMITANLIPYCLWDRVWDDHHFITVFTLKQSPTT